MQYDLPKDLNSLIQQIDPVVVHELCIKDIKDKGQNCKRSNSPEVAYIFQDLIPGWINYFKDSFTQGGRWYDTFANANQQE